MCGHGTIGVATVLVETGMVAVVEPETVIRLDVPAGLVEARVAVSRTAARGRSRSATWRRSCTPAIASSRSPASGRSRYDMAYGGNFYALTPAADAGLVVDPSRAGELIEAGLAMMEAINAADRPVHPEDPRIGGCHHVVFHEPGRDGADAVAATSIHPGWLDRSPCGTGTSARMAQLHARGELAVGEPFVNQSVIGTRFTGGWSRRRRSPGARRSFRRSRGGRGSRAWASTCSTPRIRFRRGSRCSCGTNVNGEQTVSGRQVAVGRRFLRAWRDLTPGTGLLWVEWLGSADVPP